MTVLKDVINKKLYDFIGATSSIIKPYRFSLQDNQIFNFGAVLFFVSYKILPYHLNCKIKKTFTLFCQGDVGVNFNVLVSSQSSNMEACAGEQKTPPEHCKSKKRIKNQDEKMGNRLQMTLKQQGGRRFV